MNRRPIPQLVIMEGDLSGCSEFSGFMGDDPGYIAELLGIEIDDADLITSGNVDEYDIDYLENKYPEYMGIWTTLLKIGKNVLNVGKNVVQGINKQKHDESRAKISDAVRQKILLIQQKQQQSKKNMSLILIPIALVAAYMVLKKK